MTSLKQLAYVAAPSPLISLYHLVLAYVGTWYYGNPSRKLIVIGVTGTDGKSSTTEFLNAIFEAAGKKTALSNSIRSKIGTRSASSEGRSMPGRAFLQRFLREAVDAGCTHAVVEMTSEGARQHRNAGIDLDALLFLNLAPEHIESHGSYDAYANAKFELARGLVRSRKRPRLMVANADDAQSGRYLALPVEHAIPFSLSANAPYYSDDRGGYFTFDGRKINVRIGGKFSLKNALAAATVAHALGVGVDAIEKGIGAVARIPGRMDRVEGNGFDVVVDYALTPAALELLYKTYAAQKKICVFGCAGGGRDVWKRPVLGALAEKYCDATILTNDIAYGEDPKKIIDDIASGMHKKPDIVLDRRAAIRRAVELAQHMDGQRVVLITGMGIDTEITDAGGQKIPWSDLDVAREELGRLRAPQAV